jgi:cholesterol transport system auxiliary component
MDRGSMRAALATLLLLCFTLGGCAALNLATRQPPELYALTPKTTFDADIPDLNRTVLRIETPTAAAGLNTTRIALKPTPTRLQYYAGATWIEVLPVMVENLLVESFESTGSVETLATGGTGGRADWALRVYIREFQAEYDDIDGPPVIRARLQARLLRMPTRREADFASFATVQPATTTRIDEIVVAMDAALGSTMRDLVEWTLRRIAELERGG